MSFDPTRRQLLQAALFVWALRQDDEVVDFADLEGFKVESNPASPRIKFFDLRRMTSWKTPDEEFFTFHQTQSIKVAPSTWRLSVGGFVEKPLELTLDQIRNRPDKRDLAVTIECSGNAAGPAANGMVSNGVWTGVGLASILKECGLKPEAREIAFLGMDLEREVPHGRSVYVQDAMDPNGMLAFALNGKPLSAERGFPLRVILPGWYGMTQIKWLRRIEVMDRRFEGTHMSRNYHSMIQGDAMLETSISRTRLKSVVARVTRRRNQYRISGAAWGPAGVRSVEVSIDNGPWRAATVSERDGDFAWVFWTIDWPDAKAGPHTLVSRAIDRQSRIQPTLPELRQTIKSIREDNSQWPRKIVL